MNGGRGKRNTDTRAGMHVAWQANTRTMTVPCHRERGRRLERKTHKQREREGGGGGRGARDGGVGRVGGRKYQRERGWSKCKKVKL